MVPNLFWHFGPVLRTTWGEGERRGEDTEGRAQVSTPLPPPPAVDVMGGRGQEAELRQAFLAAGGWGSLLSVTL